MHPTSRRLLANRIDRQTGTVHRLVCGSRLAAALIVGGFCGLPAPAEAELGDWAIWKATLTVDKEAPVLRLRHC